MAKSTKAGRRWTESQAREALDELAASGESVAGFARRTGVSAQRIAYWRKRVSLPKFVAVAVPSAKSAAIEILAWGVIVRVREELDVEQVARLVSAIGRRMGDAC